jgi:transposase InsO family protein
MRVELVKDAPTMALWRHRPKAGLIHYTDRGSQYACQEYQDLLEKHALVCSMSRKGDCSDNAVSERFFGSVKGESLMRAYTPPGRRPSRTSSIISRCSTTASVRIRTSASQARVSSRPWPTSLKEVSVFT